MIKDTMEGPRRNNGKYSGFAISEKVSVQVATKAPSPPWRDDFVWFEGLRKPGLGQGHKDIDMSFTPLSEKEERIARRYCNRSWVYRFRVQRLSVHLKPEP